MNEKEESNSSYTERIRQTASHSLQRAESSMKQPNSRQGRSVELEELLSKFDFSKPLPIPPNSRKTTMSSEQQKESPVIPPKPPLSAFKLGIMEKRDCERENSPRFISQRCFVNTQLRKLSTNEPKIVYTVHVAIPKTDIWKKIAFSKIITVEDAITTIIEKVNLPIEKSVKKYVLVVTKNGEPNILEPKKILCAEVPSEEVIELKAKLNPMSVRLSPIKVVNLDSVVDTIQVDLSSPSSQLVWAVCLKYGYQHDEIYLQEDGKNTQIFAGKSLKEQGVSISSLLFIRKKSKNQIEHQRHIIADIKKKSGNENSRGATLQALHDLPAEVQNQLYLRKGDRIVVLEEDDSGWWKGRIGDRVGYFPVSYCKYISEEIGIPKDSNPHVKQELEIGLQRFGSRGKVSFNQSSNLLRLIFKQRRHQEKRQTFPRNEEKCPPIVEDTLNQLRRCKAYTVEGIFRINANLKKVHEVYASYKKDKFVDLASMSVHDVAGVLKLFFRELSDPLLTFELYEPFIAAVSKQSFSLFLFTREEISDLQGRLHCVHQTLKALPNGNRMIVYSLFSFLNLIAEHSDESKMDAYNLAIVFAPSLCYPQTETVDTMMSEGPKQLIELMIRHFQELFQSDHLSIHGSRKLPATPEFDELLGHSSARLSQKLELEKHLNQDQTDDHEEDEISVHDLVETILEGNNASVEQYLESLPEERRIEKQHEMKKTLDELMSAKGLTKTHSMVKII